MSKNKKKSKGPSGRNKNAGNNQVSAAPKKEKKPERKPVEARAEAAEKKAEAPKPKSLPEEAKSKEKSFFSGIVDSVKKLVKA